MPFGLLIIGLCQNEHTNQARKKEPEDMVLGIKWLLEKDKTLLKREGKKEGKDLLLNAS